MSASVSATITSAVRWPIPGIVRSRAMTSAWSAGQLDDALVEVADGGVEPVDVVQQLTQLGGVVGGEAAVQGAHQLGDLGAHARLGQVGEHGGFTLAGDSARPHPQACVRTR
jgi:hypothetical protein